MGNFTKIYEIVGWQFLLYLLGMFVIGYISGRTRR